jgi:hypothetical protein
MIPKNTPKQIYIDAEDKELECMVEDFETLEDAKWCEDDIWEHSIRYVRSDLPTCTPTERAFLDELREKYKWYPQDGGILSNEEGTLCDLISQIHFTKSNLKELVNE